MSKASRFVGDFELVSGGGSYVLYEERGSGREVEVTRRDGDWAVRVDGRYIAKHYKSRGDALSAAADYMMRQ